MRVLLNWGLQTEEPVEPTEPIFFVKKNSIRRRRGSAFYDWNLILSFMIVIQYCIFRFWASRRKRQICQSSCVNRAQHFLLMLSKIVLVNKGTHACSFKSGFLSRTPTEYMFPIEITWSETKIRTKIRTTYFSCWDAKNNYQIVFGSSSFWMYQVDYGCYSIGIK